ncbi:peptidoglycan-binding domain-containing protein [Microlunatus soli]|uniref:Putative peptidoglycan binding domain-containing protein n=1 Tax=Microlunatus soli TaxID=630515 RepID=A0A1H1SCI6_9ACTN|nr:peptidoglycan-binding domain-containing protein [Microlunatus soli]SDS45456.1 Putative peptidoglycan binding domain-containing protein [Microlunatus soli]
MKIARAAATAAMGLALAAGSVATATAAPSADRGAAPTEATRSVQPYASCHVYWRNTAHYGGWTAGYSWAWNKIVGPGATGNRVKEIQCLLKKNGFNPGSVDGIYGSKTKKAVWNLQHYCSWTARDGIVGPDTWRCLRLRPV